MRISSFKTKIFFYLLVVGLCALFIMGSITAVNNRDYPVVQGGTIFLAITFSLCMLAVDLLYAAVDPRIKAQYASPKKAKKEKAEGKEAAANA